MGSLDSASLNFGGSVVLAPSPSSGDDTSVLNSLFVGSNKVVQLVPGSVYIIKTPINIGNGSGSAKSTTQGITLLGGGRGLPADQMGPRGGPVTIKADPAFSGSALININGPIGAVTIKGIVLDCAGVVATGLNASHAMDSHFEDILVTRWTGDAYINTAYSQPGGGGVADGAGDNLWVNCDARDPDNAASGRNGIRIGASSDGGSPHLGVSRNTYMNCKWERTSNASDSSIILQFTDASWFYGCEAVALGGGNTGNAILVNATTGNTTFPKNINFHGCALLGSYNLPVISSWPLPGEIQFYGLHAGDSAPIPAHDKLSGDTTWGQRFGRFLKVKAANETVNNSAAQNDDDLFFSAAVNEILFVEGFLLVTGASTTSDFVMNWATVPSGTTIDWGVLADNFTGGGFTSAGAGSTGLALKTEAQAITRGTGAAVKMGVSFAGLITMGGTAGTIQLQWGQATPTAENTTVHKGSFMRVTKVA